MGEMDAIYWTFSTLFQGLCALYGLLLVWYVYMMTGLVEKGESLDGEYVDVMATAREYKQPFEGARILMGGRRNRAVKVSNLVSFEERMAADMKWIGEYFHRVRRHEKKEKAVFVLLAAVSVGFMIAGVVLVYGLTFGEGGLLLWGGTAVGVGLVLFVSGVFAVYAGWFRLFGVKEREGWRLSRTSVRGVVKRGRWFFDEGLILDRPIDYVVKSRDDLRERSFIDVKAEHFACIDMDGLKKEWDKLEKFWYGWE